MGLYRMKFGSFEGSFLELLRCVKRGEIDILEVPLGQLAQGYLCELRSAGRASTDIEILQDITEQIAAFAELIRLKAQRLLNEELPAREEAAAGGDIPEPGIEPDQDLDDSSARELELRLSEYRTFLEAAQELRRREEEWMGIYSRPVLPLEEQESRPVEPARVTLSDLLSALKEVLSDIPGEEEFPPIPQEELSVKEKMDEIMRELDRAWPISFRALLRRSRERIEVIAMFLALLELIRLGLISVRQERQFEEIMIYRGSAPPAGEAVGQ